MAVELRSYVDVKLVALDVSAQAPSTALECHRQSVAKAQRKLREVLEPEEFEREPENKTISKMY